MLSKRNNKGFTLAETLIVVLIIIVLAAVAFVGVAAYQRSMTKLEYDGYAKEIFIAAQNHLTMAEGQGYLGLTGNALGEPEGDGKDGIYYFVVNVSDNSVKGYVSANANTSSLLNLMLPFASVDDTIRLGGQYIVRYHKDSAQVLDVFYWSENAHPTRFSLVNYDNSNYSDLLSKRTYDTLLKKYALGDGATGNTVVGYYGGVLAESLTYGAEIKAPIIRVVNAEALYVEVTDPNAGTANVQLKLVVTGKTSGVSRALDTTFEGYVGDGKYILDDITDGKIGEDDSKHFFSLLCNNPDPTKNLIPGEDIEIYAVAFNNDEYSNVAYSARQTTNSLFADETTADTAKIAYFRHLENLDNNTSNLSYLETKPIHITKAEQITDLVWKTDNFTGAVKPGCAYVPVSPSYALKYNGASLVGTETVIHSISNLTVSSTDPAGVFGEITVSGTEIKNLKLVDLSVSGTDAGALAGKTSGANVTNVLAYNSKSFDNDHATATITGSGSAGGLIGSVTGGTVSKSAAALVVSGANNAGGLIGTADGSAKVTDCYSGGHTTGGKYSSSAYNVTSTGSAGGLVGSTTGSVEIEFSYSTCSATGANAGGLVGSSAGSVDRCYATGLVSGTAKEGAFIGSLTGSAPTGCHYYMIINERSAGGVTDGSKGYTYLPPVGDGSGDGIAALDASADSFNSFVTNSVASAGAVPYDTGLYLYYTDRSTKTCGYALKSVAQLGGAALDKKTVLVATHYGDWPAPEIWIVNN